MLEGLLPTTKISCVGQYGLVKSELEISSLHSFKLTCFDRSLCDVSEIILIFLGSIMVVSFPLHRVLLHLFVKVPMQDSHPHTQIHRAEVRIEVLFLTFVLLLIIKKWYQKS